MIQIEAGRRQPPKWNEFRTRLTDMLACYGDRAVDAANVQGATATEIRSARLDGEALAWVMHDSYFIWQAPLANDYTSLRQFVEPDSKLNRRTPDWSRLWELATARAVQLLRNDSAGSVIGPPMLPPEKHHLWWQLMAIIHECDRQSGEIPFDASCAPSPLFIL